MKKLLIPAVITFFVIIFLSACGKDEKVTKTDSISFEEVVLNDEGFYNGSDGSGGFTSGNLIFKTNYNAGYNSWSGFAVSNNTDTITPDFTNQYSSIVGSGAGPSEKYAILYSFSSDTITFKNPAKITNIAISNSTYAYYTMLNGNAFAKKFGGPTGNDPDYFALFLTVIDAHGKRINFNPIALANYTNSNNALDYISKDWEYYDLHSAGYIKYLIFNFASSDTSAYGINTPTYVCIDNIVDEWEE
jgi:hypothetical protein